jgi:hypothetical protein
MEIRQVAPGFWFWTAHHPKWAGATHWPEEVASVYYEAADAAVLVDPLVPTGEEEEFWRALDGDVARSGLPVAILLTAPWHERSAFVVAERYGAGVWAHEAGRSRLSGPSHSGPLPAGIELFVPEGIGEGEVSFYIRPHRTLVVAEFFMGSEDGLRLRFSPALQDRNALDQSLQRLLELPVDHVLVSHGEPVLHDGQAAIQQALANG